MLLRVYQWLIKTYPQNYILRKPYMGTLIFSAFCFCFLVLYKPLNVHKARSFSLEFTMAVYCGIMSVPVWSIVKLIKWIPYFSKANEWTIIKEIISIVLVLLGMGIAIYFAGFLIETPAERWNLATFLSSCTISFMLGIIPLLFFSAINYRHLFVTDTIRNFDLPSHPTSREQDEELLWIGSQLKKEELRIYPSQIIYAESDGNYVIFYLKIDDQIKKKMIRNSISNIEQQLSAIPFFMRIHRAFIVNIKEVNAQKGNSLGYHIKLRGIDDVIPVSRQNTRDFDQLLKQFR